MKTYYEPFNSENQQSDEMMRRNFYYEEHSRLERKEIRKLGNIVGVAVLFYLINQSLAAFAIRYFNLQELYYNSPIFQDSFTVIGVEAFSVLVPFGLMAILFRKKYESPIIPTSKVGFTRGFLWVSFGMACCILLDYVMIILRNIVKLFGYKLTQGESLEPNSILSCIVCIVATAIVPPICEELAMRCFTLGLLKKYGKPFGVFAVSIVFGLLHGNVVQFIFAGTLGLILAYITIRTDSVVPAMILHGLNNGLSATQSTLTYTAGKTISGMVTVALFVIWITLGIMATIILALKKEFKMPEKENYTPYKNSTGTKLATFFFVPGMILPFMYLVYATVSTIQKI